MSDKYDEVEYLIKDAFREEFTEDYLKHMEADFGEHIREVLYMAFTRGWIERSRQE